MNQENISLTTNIYRIENLDRLFDMPVTGFKVLTYIRSESVHGLAKYIAGNIRRRFNVFAFNYVSRKGDYVYNDYVYVVGDIDAKEIIKSEHKELWSITKEYEGRIGELGPSLITRLLQELFNIVLVYNYGYYKVVKSYIHTNYGVLNGNLTSYRLYEGFYIKFLKGQGPDDFYVALDPTRTLTYNTPLIDYLKQGNVKYWIGRGMLANYTRALDGIKIIRYGVVKEIDLNTTISNYKVPTPIQARDKCGDLITLKDYYICVINALESASLDDKEPVVFLNNHAYPPSILYPVVKTEDIKSEKLEIKQVYFLTPEERYSATKKIRDLIAAIKTFNVPEIKLSETPINSVLNNIHAPRLLIGENEEVEPDLSSSSSYKRTMLNKLRTYGPYNRSKIRAGNVLFLFKKRQGVSEEMLLKLYKDLRYTAEKDFKILLPAKPKILDLSRITDESLERTKDKIMLVFVMLNNENDEDYYRLKKLFNKYNIPSQMITPKIFVYRYSADPKKKNKYKNIKRNLVIGALGKAGIIPWILKNKLHADLYVGYDIGHGPTREQPCVASFTFFDDSGRYIYTGYVRLGYQRKLSGNSRTLREMEDCFRESIERIEKIKKKKNCVNTVVIHKDGDIYDDDILVFKGLANTLKIKIALISIKKTKGFRLYRVLFDDKAESSLTGDYIILDNKRALIVTMGYGFIKQGTPRPLLIELRYVDEDFNYSILNALKDIYKLSFIHWQVVTSKTKLPATIVYADEWAFLGKYEVEFTDMPPL